MAESNININVQLDAEKVPQNINWSASGSTAEEPQNAKAMFLAFWDGADKTALRIDLWTKDMMTDEMADFFFSCVADTRDVHLRVCAGQLRNPGLRFGYHSKIRHHG